MQIRVASVSSIELLSLESSWKPTPVQDVRLKAVSQAADDYGGASKKQDVVRSPAEMKGILLAEASRLPRLAHVDLSGAGGKLHRTLRALPHATLESLSVTITTDALVESVAAILRLAFHPFSSITSHSVEALATAVNKLDTLSILTFKQASISIFTFFRPEGVQHLALSLASDEPLPHQSFFAFFSSISHSLCTLSLDDTFSNLFILGTHLVDPRPSLPALDTLFAKDPSIPFLDFRAVSLSTLTTLELKGYSIDSLNLLEELVNGSNVLGSIACKRGPTVEQGDFAAAQGRLQMVTDACLNKGVAASCGPVLVNDRRARLPNSFRVSRSNGSY